MSKLVLSLVKVVVHHHSLVPICHILYRVLLTHVIRAIGLRYHLDFQLPVVSLHLLLHKLSLTNRSLLRLMLLNAFLGLVLHS